MADSARRKSFIPPPETPVNSSVELNDDDRETEQRRRQRRLEKSTDTPVTTGAPSVISISRAKLAKMTATERIEHTEKCIQLSAANKISAKNAFSLMLIDQMVELVKEEEANFQVASTHLDASAKIYACRVDKVHSDVIRFAGGLSSNKPRPPVPDNDDDDDDAEAEGAGGADVVAPKAKAKRRRRNVIQKDPRLLYGTAHLMAVNIDELFLQQLVTCPEASEPGNCHFLLTLPISGAELKMQLRGEEPAFPPCLPESPSEHTMNMPDLRACLPLPLLPTEIHEMLVDCEMERSLSQSRAALERLEDDADVDDQHSLHDDDVDDNADVDDFAADDDPSGGATECVWTEEVAVASAAVRGPPGAGRLLTAQDFVSMHRAALGLAGGPRFWKPPRPKPSTILRPSGLQRLRKVAPTLLEFAPSDEQFAPFSPPASTKLTEATVAGWRRNSHVLATADTDAGRRFQRFSMRSRMMLNGQAEGGSPEGAELAGDGPEVMDRDASFSNFMAGDGEDDDSDGGGGGGGDPYEAEADEITDAAALAASSGILPPLNYAKRAKGIDMRALKRVCWEQIVQDLGGKENAAPSTVAATTLSHVYKQMHAKLPTKMAANLTPHLAFMSVLHLANEHNLELENTADLSELHIRRPETAAAEME